MIDDDALSADAIRAAHRAIHPAFTNSPQFVHDGLSARLGVPVIVKVETVNPIRSFKGRGTWVAIDALVRDGVLGPDRPVVCASAGNFGQGVAFAAGPAGVRSVVFASTRANRGKLARMRALGADVREVGEDFDTAVAAARAYAAESGALMLVDGDDVRISTGAATMALELTDAAERGELPSPAVVSVPVGNGALINGIGSWLRHAAPACRVVGVQAELAPAMTLSWRAGRPVDTRCRHDLRRRDRRPRLDPARRAAHGRPGRRHGARARDGAPRGPGGADRRARDHGRGRRGGVMGGAPRVAPAGGSGRRHRDRQQRLTAALLRSRAGRRTSR